MKRVLITRELDKNSPLLAWCEDHSIRLIQESYIHIHPISHLEIPKTDWVFFSSPKGVRAYFKHYKLQATKIAALSEGTAKALQEFNLNASFVGNSKLDTIQIARDFKAVISASESVFFPIGNKSLKSISNEIPASQKIESVVYNTEIKETTIPENLDLIICTSPSNGAGLFRSGLNEFYKGRVLVLGKKTMSFFEAKGITTQLSNGFTEADLLRQLEPLL